MRWVASWIFVNVFMLAPIITTAWFAARWRRNAVAWGLLAVPFSWLALGALALMGDRGRSEETARTLERIGAPNTARQFRSFPVEPPRARTLVAWLVGTAVVTAAIPVSTLFAAPKHDPRLVTMENGIPVAFHDDVAQQLVLEHTRADGMTFEQWVRARMAGRCARVDPDRIRFSTYVPRPAESTIIFLVSMSYTDPESGTCNDHRFGAWPHAVAGLESKTAQPVSLLANGSVDTDDSEIPFTWLDEFEAGLDP